MRVGYHLKGTAVKTNRRKKPVREVRVAVARAGEEAADIIFNVRKDMRDLMVQGGLAVMRAMLEEDLVALCGPRYGRAGSDGAQGHRWGSQRGVVVMGGQKIGVDKPRARKDGKEVALPTYGELSREDPLNERAFEQMVVGVSTRKYARSIETPPAPLETTSIGRSSVSRRFVAKSQGQLNAALHAPLGERHWAAIMVDGIAFVDHIVVIALGIDATGAKHVLGIREGSTENATLCREMLSDIVDRGVPADRSLLFVIDGGKGLRKAIAQVFGQYAMVQRCQVHKRRNVLEQLPEDKKPQVKKVLEQAYTPGTSAATAERQLVNLARALEEAHPSAAASLLEGLQETLTVKSLGLPEPLSRSLATTNAIENLNGTVRRVAGRVKRWRGGTMVLRWVASGVLEAQRGFHRLRGHTAMPLLCQALNNHTNNLNRDNAKQVG